MLQLEYSLFVLSVVKQQQTKPNQTKPRVDWAVLDIVVLSPNDSNQVEAVVFLTPGLNMTMSRTVQSSRGIARKHRYGSSVYNSKLIALNKFHSIHNCVPFPNPISLGDGVPPRRSNHSVGYLN